MLSDKVCLVTGASRGIGAAIADALGAEGAIVVGTATSDAGADQIGERLVAAGHRGEGAKLDVRDAEAVAELIKRVGDTRGAITILVNNAGITRDNLMMRMKPDEWHDVIDTNLNAVFNVTRACLRGMIKARQGRVINISSIVGTTGNPGQANYCATKAGVVGFTKSLAAELGSRNITVNAIAPGFIKSDMTDELPEAQREALIGQIALGRLGEPADIARAAVFLASDNANYITGQTLHINGGMAMI